MDRAKATELMRDAAAQGHSEAAFNLGLRYQLGLGTAISMEQAVNWYRKAAERRNSRALRNLGLMYANGIGVQRDLKQAYEYFCLALEYRPVGIRDQAELAEVQSKLGDARDQVADLLSQKDKADALQTVKQWSIQHKRTLDQFLSDEMAGLF